MLFDAFIVRMTIVPAVMALLGRAAWWLPRWPDRALPNGDIEAERLRQAPGGQPGPAGRAGPTPARPGRAGLVRAGHRAWISP